MALGQPRQRVEPVDGRDQAPREQPPRVAAREVHELVLDDDAPTLVGPAFRRRRQQHGGARPAAGQWSLDRVGPEQRHRPGRPTARLVSAAVSSQGPRERSRRGPKQLLAAQRARQSEERGRPAQEPDGEEDEPSESATSTLPGSSRHSARDARRLARGWPPSAARSLDLRGRRDRKPERTSDRTAVRAVGLDPARHEPELPPRQERRKRRRQEQPDRGQRQQQVARARGLATQQHARGRAPPRARAWSGA